jgi:predicted phosphodiesterase
LNYELLRKHATETQVRYIDAIKEHGSYRKAAEALGVSDGSISNAIASAKKRAARKEPLAHVNTAPVGYDLSGVSTQRKVIDPETGQEVLQWVKTKKSNVIEPGAFIELFKQALDEAPPRTRTMIPAASHHEKDLLANYTMGDPHIGMLSWAAETGTDFDLKIAEAHLVEAMRQLVALAPAASMAAIWNLGDFFHADNAAGVTARSGHKLDTDSRYQKMMQVGVRTKIACIDRALEKHEIVEVFVVMGNHDDHSAVALNLILIHHYRNNPRVIFRHVIQPFQFLEFGQNLIGTTHGHTVKAEKLPGIMARKAPAAWGRTKHWHWFTGHVHHYEGKEYDGVLVEKFNTLAGYDAWTNESGYGSDRNMKLNVHHREFGRVLTHTVGVQALEAAL